MDYSKEELENLTTIYDKYSPKLIALAKKPSTFQMLKSEFTRLLEKNNSALQTNILGRQLVITQKDEDRFLDILELDRADMTQSIKTSPYFVKFDEAGHLSLLNQYVFAFPFIIMSYEYKKLGKKDYARICYMLTFFKPYASRISLLFGKYPVNEDQMLYTVEHMTEKSDLKKLGTLFEVIAKKSDASFENYFGDISPKYRLTDCELGKIYSSGVATRINNFLLDISTKYRMNSGKYMAFENNSNAFEDDEGSDIVDRDIDSDAAMRVNIVNKAINAATIAPIDLKLIRSISKLVFMSDSQYYQTLMSDTVVRVAEHMSKNLQEFFTCMINSFLFTSNPHTGGKYTMEDFKTVTFPAVMNKKVYNNPNTSDKNILRVKVLLDQMLEYCDEYDAKMPTKTKNRNIRNAIFLYWVWFLQKAGR